MAFPRLPLSGALLLGASQGLRMNEPAPGGWIEWPTGPEIEPEGRHIQMLFLNHGHGLTDRMTHYLRPLVALGAYHNATVHIVGGAGGPGRFLTKDHSLELPESWGRYFDLEANGGNPWHEPKNFKGCREIREPPSLKEALHLFDRGERCVNFLAEVPNSGMMPKEVVAQASLPVSKEVLEAAAKFRARYRLPESYGSCHIRRCDLLAEHAECTAPGQVARMIREEGQGLTTWLFFLYAEASYRPALQHALAPLGIRAIIEDSAVLNEAYPEDNYFSYLVGKYLNGGASTILETHGCKKGKPGVFHGPDIQGHGLFLNRWTSEDTAADRELAEGFMEVGEQVGAVCDGRSRGAKLVHPHPL